LHLPVSRVTHGIKIYQSAKVESGFRLNNMHHTEGIRMAALTGATVISSLSYYIFFGSCHWDIIAILSVSAFIACFVDSLLGTFFEDKMLKMNYFKKRKTLESITPNDLVNMIGSVTAFVFYILLSWVFD
jgi:uncharacterized membrane protein